MIHFFPDTPATFKAHIQHVSLTKAPSPPNFVWMNFSGKKALRFDFMIPAVIRMQFGKK